MTASVVHDILGYGRHDLQLVPSIFPCLVRSLIDQVYYHHYKEVCSASSQMSNRRGYVRINFGLASELCCGYLKINYPTTRTNGSPSTYISACIVAG